MRKRRIFTGLVAAGCLALGAPVWGATDDAGFVKGAASGGMLEVELGRHVAKNAANPEVRAFGERMISDHGAANRELEGLARRLGLAFPAEMEKEHREMLAKLAALRGAELDRAYMEAMVEDHEHDVDEFREQATQQSSEVDRWAARTLPTLEAHLAQAEAIAQRIEASAPTAPDATHTPARP